jgi:hypothetical protein
MRNCQRCEVVYATVFLLLLMPVAGRAQDQPPDEPQAQPTNQMPPTAPVAQPKGSEAESGILASPNRILDVIPNFITVNDTPANRVPLTTRQKYDLAWVSTYDFSAQLGNLLESGIQQWTNGEPHYGTNLAAFGKRFAASEGDQVTSSLFIHGLLPSVLKEDPRYFRLGKGPLGARLSRAVTGVFVIRTDSGGHAFNTPAILGQLMQAGVSNFYYPPQDRSVNGTIKDLGINVVYDAAFNIIKEFYPDVLDKLKRKHATTPPAISPLGAPR